DGRLAGKSPPRRARQRLRVLSRQAVVGVFAGRGDPRRGRPRVRRRQARAAAAVLCQRRAVRETQCRRRHDLRFSHPDRACGVDAAALPRHDRGLGHRVEQGSGWRPRPADRRRRARLRLHCRAAHGRDAAHRQARNAVPEIRRPRPHRDARCAGPLDLRRDRSAGDAPCCRARARAPNDPRTGMSKGFASTADSGEKTISFTRLGSGLYAFTAEGDPNSGVIVGDDAVMIVDAQATPVMAREVVDRVAKVTDKPIRYVLLSHYHAVRVLGASAYRGAEILASDTTRGLIAERGQADMDSEIGRFPRLFRAVESIPGLTWPTLTFPTELSVWLGKREVRIMHLGRAPTPGD